jgi:DNA-binding HxlR family transcriptional regulator
VKRVMVRYNTEAHRGRAAGRDSRLMQAGEIAPACDLVGKRWALQVVRELARGPWRFTDLHQSLRGISTNVLAARLRELQQANLVRRRLLPPPAGSMVYELTDGGRELSRIVLKLEQWGERSLAAGAPDATAAAAPPVDPPAVRQ